MSFWEVFFAVLLALYAFTATVLATTTVTEIYSDLKIEWNKKGHGNLRNFPAVISRAMTEMGALIVVAVLSPILIGVILSKWK